MNNPAEFLQENSRPTVNQPSKKKRPPFRLALFLFVSTGLTTLFAGYSLHLGFLYQAGELTSYPSLAALAMDPSLILTGLPFAAALMLILVAHESGHYFACRYYGINCTLPYLIPAPPFLNMFGTFGALIRIKSPFIHRRQLFDVGIAGPIAGFVVTLPVLVIGLLLSGQNVMPESGNGYTLLFGEPLLFKLASVLLFEGEGADLNLHPLGWAAWIGMLATSLNLLPAGQLDGGHIVYALFGNRTHALLSWMTAGGLLLLGLWSWPVLAYLLFGILLLIMKLTHPPTLLDSEMVDPARRFLGAVALAIFILTFIPVPVQISGTL